MGLIIEKVTPIVAPFAIDCWNCIVMVVLEIEHRRIENPFK
jgi:hypothetical protein